MVETVSTYPLTWPPMWPRTDDPQYSRFETTITRARNGVIRELDLLGATDITISSNAELTRSGEISARQRRIDDTGVAVYFRLDGDQRVIPCDKWVRIEENLRAIELTINALRGIERWGAREIMTAAFAGFAALPASSAGDAWWEVLGVPPTATIAEIDAAYRRLAKQTHPDAGGSAGQFSRIAAAHHDARTALVARG